MDRTARSIAKGGDKGEHAPINPECPPLEEEIVQWPCLLIDRLSGLLRKIEPFMGCSVGFEYAKNALAAGTPPGPNLGELRRFPRPFSRLERETPVQMPNSFGARGI